MGRLTCTIAAPVNLGGEFVPLDSPAALAETGREQHLCLGTLEVLADVLAERRYDWRLPRVGVRRLKEQQMLVALSIGLREHFGFAPVPRAQASRQVGSWIRSGPG